MTGTASPLSLVGTSVLITGGSRGLGREMALAVAGAGADVMVSGQSSSKALHQTCLDLEAVSDALNRKGQVGGKVDRFVADVGNADDCEGLVSAAIMSFGKLDVLINNAGIGMRQVSETFNTAPATFWNTSPQDWRTIMDANVNGTFYMARLAAKHMVGRGYGKIINISTSAQTMVRKGYSPYGPSKAALEAASRVWAQDLEGTGVTVNVYLPGGASDTDFIPGGTDRRGADGNLLPASIMRRGAIWLCSSASNDTTGARFTARLWDVEAEPEFAAMGARSENCTSPEIM